MSGEWIVFQKYNEKNYYLTLAAHDEGDENIFKREMMLMTLILVFLRENA